jgi:hypothetical protein
VPRLRQHTGGEKEIDRRGSRCDVAVQVPWHCLRGKEER